MAGKVYCGVWGISVGASTLKILKIVTHLATWIEWTICLHIN